MAATKDTYWAHATPQSKAQRAEIHYFPVPAKPFETSRYAVTINGVMVGEVNQWGRCPRWGGLSALPLPDKSGQTTHRIPSLHDRRREAAITLIQRNLYAHPQLAQAAGIC